MFKNNTNDVKTKWFFEPDFKIPLCDITPRNPQLKNPQISNPNCEKTSVSESFERLGFVVECRSLCSPHNVSKLLESEVFSQLGLLIWGVFELEISWIYVA